MNDFRPEATKAKDTKSKPTRAGGDHGYRDKVKQVAAIGHDFKGEGNRSSHWRDMYNERKKEVGPRNGCYFCKDSSHSYKDFYSLRKLGALFGAERRQAQGGAQAGEVAQERQDVAHLGHMMLGALLTKELVLRQDTLEKHDLAQMSHMLLGVVISKEPRLREK